MSHTVGPFLFLLGAIYYAWRSGSAASPGPERRFWRKLAGSYVIWA